MSEIAMPEEGQDRPRPKLMVNGFVCPEKGCLLSKEVRRGMTIRSSEGLEVGKVAAVAIDGQDERASHLLLSRLPNMPGYWLVPVDSIIEVGEEEIRLSTPKDQVEALPRWQSD